MQRGSGIGGKEGEEERGEGQIKSRSDREGRGGRTEEVEGEGQKGRGVGGKERWKSVGAEVR